MALRQSISSVLSVHEDPTSKLSNADDDETVSDEADEDMADTNEASETIITQDPSEMMCFPTGEVDETGAPSKSMTPHKSASATPKPKVKVEQFFLSHKILEHILLYIYRVVCICEHMLSLYPNVFIFCCSLPRRILPPKNREHPR